MSLGLALAIFGAAIAAAVFFGAVIAPNIGKRIILFLLPFFPHLLFKDVCAFRAIWRV